MIINQNQDDYPDPLLRRAAPGCASGSVISQRLTEERVLIHAGMHKPELSLNGRLRSGQHTNCRANSIYPQRGVLNRSL